MSVCRDVGPSIHGFASPTIERKHKLHSRVKIYLRVLHLDHGKLGVLVDPMGWLADHSMVGRHAHLAPLSLNLHRNTSSTSGTYYLIKYDGPTCSPIKCTWLQRSSKKTNRKLPNIRFLDCSKFRHFHV